MYLHNKYITLYILNFFPRVFVLTRLFVILSSFFLFTSIAPRILLIRKSKSILFHLLVFICLCLSLFFILCCLFSIMLLFMMKAQPSVFMLAIPREDLRLPAEHWHTHTSNTYIHGGCIIAYYCDDNNAIQWFVFYFSLFHWTYRCIGFALCIRRLIVRLHKSCSGALRCFQKLFVRVSMCVEQKISKRAHWALSVHKRKALAKKTYTPRERPFTKGTQTKHESKRVNKWERAKEIQ